MRRFFIENIAFYILVTFVVVGFGYGIYTSFFSDTRALAERAISNQLHQCQRIKGRSALVEQFMLDAAEARRRGASLADQRGDKVAAQNELATAMKYEKLAEQHNQLVIKDCVAEYQP